jgi:hypothetical protein
MNCRVVAQDGNGKALRDLDGAGRVEKVDGLGDLVREDPPRETTDGKDGRTNDE